MVMNNNDHKTIEVDVTPSDRNDSVWEREFIQRLATQSLVDQRKRRRWSVFFKLALLSYLCFMTLWLTGLVTLPVKTSSSLPPESRQPHVGLVNLVGQIGSDGFASAERVNEGLRRAFKSDKVLAVILRINSPGGSPVQSGLINEEIVRLRAKYTEKPIYAVVEDVCASGGYYVAVAADEIYANKASMVGSIGVVMSGFGFTGSMQKLGVERRLITAGTNKGFLDPFSEEDPEHVAFVKEMMGQVHDQFIQVVKEGRGDRLKVSDQLFSGLVWTGEKSLEMGLIDGLGSVDSVMRDVVETDHMVDYTPQRTFLEQFAGRAGVFFGKSFSSALGLGVTPSY